ncbi:MAG: DegT/DnrJ/EryC1/StrS family aminotransferase [Pseudolabrys sp.]
MSKAMPRAVTAAERIPLVDLQAQYRLYRGELDAAVARVVGDASFIGGTEHAAFAQEFAAFCGGGHVALVGNGTDALTLAIIEAIGQGDGKGEIVTTSFTFVATTEAIVNAGYRPVLADIDPATCLTPAATLEAAITPATRALMPVHLYGQMADMRAVRALADRKGLGLIEDAAQAHGARRDGVSPGELGDAACFSFYPGKNLGGWGDGGAVFSKDVRLIDGITSRADHGRKDKYLHDTQGSNSRLDTLQAAVLRAKLPHLSEWNEARRAAAARYDELLAGENRIQTPSVDPYAEHVFHLYVVQVDERDSVRQYLNKRGIGAGVHYPVPVHEQPAFLSLGYAAGDLPHTSRAAKRVLSLPIYPEISDAQMERVARTLIEAVRA